MEDTELNKALAERFKELPKVVRDAITSADIESHMRQLADTHKIHIDQWALLENEVMLTLLGLERMQDLAKNIASHTTIEASVATALAEDISKIVFAPIREELEKLLPEPEGSASAEGAIEARERPVTPAPIAAPAEPAATEVPVEPAPTPIPAAAATPTEAPTAAELTPNLVATTPLEAPTPLPETATSEIVRAEPQKRITIASTPPRSAPETTVKRAPISQNYAAAVPSHERVSIEGDPYREQVA